MKNITIVGLGLMGGSLAAACRKSFSQVRIIGVSRDRKALSLALKRKWVHAATSDFGAGVRDADLVVLCTPVDTLKSMLQKIEKNAKSGTLVTDVGSVKGDIQRWADKREFKKIHFVGAHPLVGSHDRGLEAARPDLYSRGFTFVTRTSRQSAKSFSAVKQFWQKITPRVFTVTPEEHDQITAEISHLPHLAAFCLALTPQESSLKFAGTGFLDTTRIAQGHPSVWGPIFMANRRAVLAVLSGFEAHLKAFKKALKKPGSGLENLLLKASLRRREI